MHGAYSVNQNTHSMFSNFFFLKPFRVWENLEKSIVEGGRPHTHTHMTVWGMRVECCYLRLQTHTLSLCNIRCFSCTTIVIRTRPSVTLYVQCLSLFLQFVTSPCHPSVAHNLSGRSLPPSVMRLLLALGTAVIDFQLLRGRLVASVGGLVTGVERRWRKFICDVTTAQMPREKCCVQLHEDIKSSGTRVFGYNCVIFM